MDDFRKLQQFLLVLPEALRNAASPRQNIDQFGRGLSEALGLEIGRSTAAPRPATKRPVVTEDFESRIPTPLPNEILQGWRGRVAALNCKSNIRDADRPLLALGKEKMPSLGNDPDFVQYSAAVLGIAPQDLIRCHTLTPFFDTLGDLKQNKPGRPGRHLRSYQRRAPLRIDSKHALFCRHCVEEDLAKWKFSYWRRSHHLPGVYCCGTHAAPLLSAGGHNSFDRCPHHFLEAPVEERIAPRSGAAVAILLRYAQIAAEILDSAPSIDSSAASFILGKRAKAADLRISGIGSRTTLSAHIMKTVPLEWLQETFPRVQWCLNKYISTIDGACTPRATRYTASTLCLIAAVLYDDADEAIAELMNCTASNRDHPLGFDFWASKAVFDIYSANRGIVSRVADALGLPLSTVSLGLLNQGLPGLGKATASMDALRAFATGQRLDDACRAASVSEAVEEILRAMVRARLAPALSKTPDAMPVANKPIQADLVPIGPDIEDKDSKR